MKLKSSLRWPVVRHLMSSIRTFRYIVRAASQPERDAVQLRQQSMKAAKAEFVRDNPKFNDEEILCRRYNSGDAYSDAMNNELQ